MSKVVKYTIKSTKTANILYYDHTLSLFDTTPQIGSIIDLNFIEKEDGEFVTTANKKYGVDSVSYYNEIINERCIENGKYVYKPSLIERYIIIWVTELEEDHKNRLGYTR